MGGVLVLLMHGKAVYGLVPGLLIVAGCLASWITRQERRLNAVLKIEGMQLAKNLLSTTVMWSSSLLFIQGSRIFFSALCS